jgi:hypothetical protein
VTAALPSSAQLNPAQQAVLDALGSPGGDWPAFDVGLRHELRATLEDGLGPAVTSANELGLLPLHVTKHVLSSVHGCEARFLGESNDFPGWSIPTARGAVAHKAIELSVNLRGNALPRDLVDDALDRLTESENGLATWLQGISEIERAELRAVANDRVATFLEAWPPLVSKWRPVTEARIRSEVCEGAIVLQGKVDLTLGMAAGTTARKVLVDLKSGAFSPAHLEDLRFYALLETLKLGVPPRRVATYYLESATCEPLDVTDAVLRSAARRVVDGVDRLVALRGGQAQPVYRPGPACRWCPLLASCEAGRAAARQDA